MTRDDFTRFSNFIIAAAEAVDRKLSAERIAIYFDDLFDLDIRAIQYAVKEHRKISPHFPRVSEIRERAMLWRPPRPYAIQGAAPKMLEAPEVMEERRQENLSRFKELLASLGELDSNFGTNLKKPDLEERRRELERQAAKIKTGAI